MRDRNDLEFPDPELVDAFYYLLKRWAYEWFVTLTFPEHPRYGPDIVKSLLKNWTRKLCTHEKIQVGYCYSLTYSGLQAHLHLLMVGRGKHGNVEKTLDDVNRKKWEENWPYMHKKRRRRFLAEIDTPHSLSRVTSYVSSHLRNVYYGEPEMDFYNVKLLKKLKIPLAIKRLKLGTKK